MTDERDLRIALITLARLVHEDNPSDIPLSEIAFRWANASTHEVDALRRLEADGGPLESFRPDRSSSGE